MSAVREVLDVYHSETTLSISDGAGSFERADSSLQLLSQWGKLSIGTVFHHRDAPASCSDNAVRRVHLRSTADELEASLRSEMPCGSAVVGALEGAVRV